MARIDCYLPAEIERKLRRRAEARNLPLSAYIAEILASSVRGDRPANRAELAYGGWKDPIERAPQGESEKRRPL